MKPAPDVLVDEALDAHGPDAVDRHLVAQRRQRQHAQVGIGLEKLRRDIETVAVGQLEIEYDHIRVRRRDLIVKSLRKPLKFPFHQ